MIFALPSSQARSRAFSLIEAAIVLGVIGLVVGGIWAGAAALRSKFMEREFFEGMGELAALSQSYLNQQIPCNTHLSKAPGQCCGTPAFQGIIRPQRLTADVMKAVSKHTYYDADLSVRCDSNNVRYVELSWGDMHGDTCQYLSRVLNLASSCNTWAHVQQFRIEIPSRN